jgi:nitrite reductase/ring-hydroxylating ferredoxin subunit
MLVASYFGGEMTFGFGTEVNRQAWAELPEKWEQLDVTAASLEDRKPVVAKTKAGVDLFVASLDGAVYVIGNTCTHAGGPLNEGTWVGADRCEIQCPWHGSRFCVKDGTAHGGPATFGEPRFDSRVAGNGRLEVRLEP